MINNINGKHSITNRIKANNPQTMKVEIQTYSEVVDDESILPLFGRKTLR